MSSRRSRQRSKSPQVRIEHVLMKRPPSLIQPATVAGRVLLGWMSDAQVAFYGAIPDTEQQQIVAGVDRARAAVASRDGGLNQAHAILPSPPEVANHGEAFLGSALGQTYARIGYSIALIDLSSIVALQVHVRLPSCQQRVSAVRPRDLVSIARTTLPYEGTNTCEVAYDGAKSSWLIGSDDPNLRAAGPVGPDGGEGGFAVGFRLESPLSVMLVQRYQGRLFLCDGYHRAVGLLRGGVQLAPALVRDAQAFEDLPAIGQLPVDSFMGDRPPVLPDYLNNDVSMQVQVPSSTRRFLINAMLLP